MQSLTASSTELLGSKLWDSRLPLAILRALPPFFLLAACHGEATDAYQTLLLSSSASRSRANVDANAEREDFGPDAERGEGLGATWLGNAGIALDDGATTILIDPFVSRPPLLQVLLGRDLVVDEPLIDEWLRDPVIADARAILITHTHYDHVMDAPSFAEKTRSVLFGSESTAHIARSAGLPEAQIRTVTPGTHITIGNFMVKFIETCHGPHIPGVTFANGTVARNSPLPGSVWRYQMGLNFALLIEHPLGRILHKSGPCVLPGNFRDVRADLVFIGVSGWKPARDIVTDIVEPVSASRIIPIHFDNFTQPVSDPVTFLPINKLAGFRELSEVRHDLTIHTLPIGRRRILFP